MAKNKQKKSKQGSKQKPGKGHAPHDPEGPRLDTLARALAQDVHAALPEAAGLSADDVNGLLERPPTPDMGDFAFPCFRLARTLRKGPPVIAKELAEQLKSTGELIEEATALGPYVNLRLNMGRAGALLLPKLANEQFERPPARATRIMVEYSQPNTHKAFHVGHMRNLCLGDAIVRLLRADGYPVIAANYFGDVGAHIAKCLWWYLDHLTDEQRQPPDEFRGEWLGRIYTAASNQMADWEEQAKAGDAAATAALAAAKARTTEILHRLESREPEMTAVWKQTRDWSLEEFAEIYKWSDAGFDTLFYESQVDEPGLKLVEEFLEKGVFTVSEGAVGIFNEEIKHMPFFMLRKRDGNGLYSTKDLALARMKFENHAIDRSIYVVDLRQSDHFKHVFLTLKKMGFQQAEQCQHVPYEMVEMTDGPMSARKGNVILFRDLREQMTRAITEKYLEQFRDEWGDEEIAKTADAVALGSIRYGMLGRDVNQKIVFDMSAWINIEGNSGAYLQYTYARAGSVLRRCAEEGKTLDAALLEGGDERGISAVTAQLVAPQERELVLALTGLERTLHAAAAQLRPSIVCTYLYNLCKAFNRFHFSCNVKNSEGALLQARLLLVTASTRALRQALSVLGIPAPARM